MKIKITDFRIYSTLILILLTVFVLIQSRNREVELNEEVLLPVTTIQPLFGTLEKSYTLNGYVESNDVVTILPKVSGTLNELNIEVGDFINKSKTLAVIDNEQLLLTQAQARSSYLSSKETFERQEILYKSNTTSRQNYEQAKTLYEVNKAQYELANLQLSYAHIKSPISGTVLQIHTNEGNLLSPGVPIATIGTLDDLIFRANIPEKYYEYFFYNENQMEIVLTRPDNPYNMYKTNIRYLSPVINPDTMSFEVVCDIEEDIKVLRPGMFMKALFALDKIDDIYYLPVESIRNSEAWYVDETFRAHKITIPPGFTNEKFIQIPNSLKDKVFIKEGYYFLNEGQKVNVLRDSPK